MDINYIAGSVRWSMTTALERWTIFLSIWQMWPFRQVRHYRQYTRSGSNSTQGHSELNSTHGHSDRSDSTHTQDKQYTWIFRQVRQYTRSASNSTHDYLGRSDSTHAQDKQYTWIFRQVRQYTRSGQTVHLNIQAGQTVTRSGSNSPHGYSGRLAGQTAHTRRSSDTQEYSGRSDSTHAQVKQYTWIFRQVRPYTRGQVKQNTWPFRQVRQYTRPGQAVHMAIQAGQTVHMLRVKQYIHMNIQAGQTVHTLRSSSTHQCQHYQGIFDSIQYHSR